MAVRLSALLLSSYGPFALLAASPGCSSSGSSPSSDASADSSDLGSDTGAAAPSCGSTMCPAIPMQAAAYVTACCTADGGCGGQTPLASSCLPYGALGGMDPSCPAYAAPTGKLPGCCRPDNQCGAYDGTLGLGCIANASINQPAKACNYVANDCTEVAPVVCDGPEDCPSGNTCCGLYSGGSYAQFKCMGSCADAGAPDDAGGTALWFEMCHAGQTCQSSGSMCLTSLYLPTFLYRCYTSGSPAPASPGAGPGVNCGSTTCSAGEECCLRQPHDPYCAPAGTACACAGPGSTDAGAEGGPDAGGAADAGGADAGDAEDAGGADATPPADAGAGG